MKLPKLDEGFRRFLSAALAFVFSQVFASAVLAQFTVSPIIIELTGYPGGLRTFTFSVGNTGEEPLDCTIGVSAMAVMGGGMPVEVEDAPRSCKDWITVTPETFRLAPKDGIRLVCHVRVPRNTGGGYYAIISCHGVPMRGSDERAAASGVGGAIQFSHRSLVPVLLTIPAPQMQAVIDAAQPLISEIKQGKGYEFDLPVRNRGNVHARMTGTVEVRSEAEQLVDRFELEAGRGFILPDHERLFKNRGTVNLPDGVYLMRVRLEAQGSARPMQNAFPFYVKEGRPQVAEITDELRAKLQKQSAGFIVSPAQMQVSLRPGGSRSQAVELVNLTRDTIDLQASLMEWYRGADSNDLITESAALHGRSARDAVTLREQAIQLRPLSRCRVPITVALPKEAAGERYAALTFDRADVQLDASPAGRVRRSTMVRIYAEGTGQIIGEIMRFEATPQPNGAIDLTMQFRNTGNVGFTPEVSFRIVDEYDSPIGKVTPAMAPLLTQAGCEAVVSAEWSKVLDPGQYTAEATFRASQNKPPLVERAKFVVPKASSSPVTTSAESKK